MRLKRTELLYMAWNVPTRKCQPATQFCYRSDRTDRISWLFSCCVYALILYFVTPLLCTVLSASQDKETTIFSDQIQTKLRTSSRVAQRAQQAKSGVAPQYMNRTSRNNLL